MVAASEAAEEYRSVLSELTRNDKTQINLLTILAEDYASYSSEIVRVIEEMVYKSSPPLKIIILYVVDSILKNIPTANGGYKDLFAKKIVEMIVHVFKESEERVRASLHRLRLTWGDIFPRSKLYMIDTRINGIDKAWPILHPNSGGQMAVGVAQPSARGGQVVHVNPRFLNGTTAASAPPQKTITSVAQEKQKLPEKPKESPLKKEVKSEPKEEPVSSTTPEASLFITIENKTAANSNQKSAERKPKVSGKESADGKQSTPSAAQKPAQKNSKAKMRTEEKPLSRKNNEGLQKAPMHRKSDVIPMNRIPKKTPRQMEVEAKKPESLLSLKLNPPPTLMSQQQQGVPPQKKPRRSSQTGTSEQQQQQHTPLLMQKKEPPKMMNALPEPTAALGFHAFGRNVVAAKAAQSIAGAGTPPVGEQPPPAQCSRTGAAPPRSFADQSLMSMPFPQSSFAVPPPIDSSIPFMTQPIPQTMPMPVHNIQNVTPRLPGVPENNRIFVDGKSYEVFYLEEVAVIERNGLPHRVMFAGPPRDVIIDGAAHRMSFGEQKQVLIDGEVHVLRFGAPSRELYMGNFPFKGAFGGPPIIATVNGRRHEIRLCGPPPEVRIDPEPSYELMRYMPTVRQQQPVVQQPKAAEPEKDIVRLLKKLKNSGVLSQLGAEEQRRRERQAALEARAAAVSGPDSQPIPSSHRLDHIERRAAPMSGLDQFSMRSLIIRYDSVIEAIHRPRVVCQYCGIGFQELYSEAYQRHADWHLQDTIKLKDSRYNYNRSQPWYMLDDWFTYSETEQVNKVAGQTGTDGDKTGDPEKDAAAAQQPAGGTGNQDAPSSTVETRECQVCHEQFEEYYDEDEDVWRLRSCIVVSDKAFHSFCKDEAAEMEQTLEEGPDTDSDMRQDSSTAAHDEDGDQHMEEDCQPSAGTEKDVGVERMEVSQLEEVVGVCVDNKDEESGGRASP